MKHQIIAFLILSVLAFHTANAAGYPSYGTAANYEVEVSQYPAADINSLYASSSTTESANQNTFGAIQSARQTIITSTRSIDSLFTRVPTSAELD